MKKPFVFLLVILSYIAGSKCAWQSPPAGQVEWGVPSAINITVDELNDVDIYLLENTGNDWGTDDDEYFPICEFLVDNATEEVGFNRLTGDYEFRKMEDGRFVWFSRKHFDADRYDYYLSWLKTKPDMETQYFVIHVIDYNDEIPVWENGNWTHHTQHILETLEWGEEGDTESASRRIIYEMNFSDRDVTMTEFSVEIDNPECRATKPKAVCDEILSLIEIDIPYPIVGRALVRRTKGKLIDRETRDLFDGDSNELKFLITIFDNDRTNNITSDLTLIVDDRNDNAPEFLTEESLLVEVKEDDIVANKPFGQIKLRDLDDAKLPNGNFTVSIKAIKKDPSSPSDPALNTLFGLGVLSGSGSGNEFVIDVIPKTSNFFGLSATYTLTLEAKDGESSEPKQLSSEKDYRIVVTN